MALFSKQSTWEKIRDAVADRAGDWYGAAHDAASGGLDAAGSAGQRVGQTVGRGVQLGAQASADAVKAGAVAVGRGVAAVDHKVESVANGVLAGAIAGALAAWAMNQFQAINAKSAQAHAAASGAANAGGGTERTSQDGGSENATVQVAEQISQQVAGRSLTEEEKPAAGNAVHYGYGAAMGAVYGGLAELVPVVGTGLGLPYATALWLFGDEIATSALGLGKSQKDTTPAEHAASLSAHFVYGVTLDVARRVLRHIV